MDTTMELSPVLLPYTDPRCRVIEVRTDHNFLASGDFGQGGYPGDDLDPGDEYNF